MNQPRTIYRRFIGFEERAAAIYLKMASHFSADRRLGAFWLDMGIEEKQHAGLLQFCLAEDLFSPDLPGVTEIRRLDGLFDKFEKRAASPKLTVDEAFTIATEMETSEVNAIYCHLTTPLHRSMYLLRRKISTFAPEHVSNLIKAARTFGVRDETMKELAGLNRKLKRPPVQTTKARPSET